MKNYRSLSKAYKVNQIKDKESSFVANQSGVFDTLYKTQYAGQRSSVALETKAALPRDLIQISNKSIL